MYKSNWGSRNQIAFNDEHEYYELLGFLAKSDGSSSITWERNEEQGAWGSEGRLLFYTNNIPVTAYMSRTAGTGNISFRVNCNEFVENIITNHGFVEGKNQDIATILATVPAEYQVDFNRGAGEGADDEDTSSGETIITPFKPEDIKIANPPMNLGDLIDMLDANWINLNTEYQREGNLWKGNKPSRLIESVLLGLRLPAFYFEEVSKKQWNVIDGLQRCWVIKNFCVDQIFALDDLEFLSQFDGGKFRYNDFPYEIKRDIRMLPITVNVVDSSSPEQVKFILFKRLNSGGVELTSQEVRNAVYNGIAIETLKRMLPSFQTATENRISNERKEAEDFIARYAAFYVTSYTVYEPDLDKFVNKALATIRDNYTQNQRDKMVTDFHKAMNIANEIFGNDAFRKRSDPDAIRGRINKAYFEVIANIFARLSGKEAGQLILNKSLLKQNLIEIMSNDGFYKSLSSATGNREAVNKRFSWFKSVVEHSINGETIKVDDNKIKIGQL